MKSVLLAILGAVVGAVVGHFGYVWIYSHGFAVLLLPGLLVGIGAAIPRSTSLVVPILSGAIALATGIYTEWVTEPFIKNDTFGYFIAHLGMVSPVMLVFIGLGAAAAAWIPMRERTKSA